LPLALESKISDETRQDDWVFHFGSTIRLLSIKRFHQVLQFVQKNSSICKMKEKQTPCWFAIAIDNVKNRTALFMELLGGEDNAVSSLCFFNLIYNLNLNFIFYLLQVNT
jgi:hypothetical protein